MRKSVHPDSSHLLEAVLELDPSAITKDDVTRIFNTRASRSIPLYWITWLLAEYNASHEERAQALASRLAASDLTDDLRWICWAVTKYSRILILPVPRQETNPPTLTGSSGIHPGWRILLLLTQSEIARNFHPDAKRAYGFAFEAASCAREQLGGTVFHALAVIEQLVGRSIYAHTGGQPTLHNLVEEAFSLPVVRNTPWIAAYAHTACAVAFKDIDVRRSAYHALRGARCARATLADRSFFLCLDCYVEVRFSVDTAEMVIGNLIRFSSARGHLQRSPHFIVLLLRIGAMLVDLEDYEAARPFFRYAVDRLERAAPSLAHLVRSYLALTLARSGRTNEALSLAMSCLEDFHPSRQMAKTVRHCMTVFLLCNAPSKAREMLRRFDETSSKSGVSRDADINILALWTGLATGDLTWDADVENVLLSHAATGATVDRLRRIRYCLDCSTAMGRDLADLPSESVFDELITVRERLRQSLVVFAEDVQREHFDRLIRTTHEQQRELARINERMRRRNADLRSIVAQLQATLGQRDHLLEENRRLLRFVAHDLKSPVGALRLLGEGFADDRERSGAEYREFARDVVQVAERVMRLSSALLDLTADGKVPLMDEHCDLTQICERVVRMCGVEGAERGVSIVMDAPGTLFVKGSENLVESIIENLLSNAVRCSPMFAVVVLRIRKRGERTQCSIENAYTTLPREVTVPPTSGRSGIGLTIVRTLAASLRARVRTTHSDTIHRTTVSFPN